MNDRPPTTYAIPLGSTLLSPFVRTDGTRELRRVDPMARVVKMPDAPGTFVRFVTHHAPEWRGPIEGDWLVGRDGRWRASITWRELADQAPPAPSPG